MGKVKEIENMLFDIYKNIGIDKPTNHENILPFVVKDVAETADPKNWHSGDVAIAFRRWLESNNTFVPLEKRTVSKPTDEKCTNGLHVGKLELNIPTGIKATKGGELKVNDKTKCTFICAHCGSDNIQLQAWVKPNENNLFVDYTADEVGWCNDCKLHSQIDSCEIKTSAKVVGFQVVGEDGTEQEGNIHPDMDASFCLYNLTQAHEMLDDDSQWRLLTVWDGDVEEPTMMFEGDPRA